jgi:glutathione synthase/RimK-type ligase-like ATP-grasp enzyme
MILVAGIPSERPVALAIEALRRQGAEFLVLNQRRTPLADLRLAITPNGVNGVLDYDGQRIRLDEISGVYARLMDDRLLPELLDEPPDSDVRRRVRAFHADLGAWFDMAPIPVVNRPSSMRSNSSKPYQASLISEAGIDVPPTLVTNDPDAVMRFRSEHGRIIYKSISSARSIVRELDEEGCDRLELIRWCPTQFQAWVPGTDVRVHVVGGDVHATAIDTTGIDYRYTRGTGDTTELRPVELSAELADRCRALTDSLGLEFSGIDLRVDDDGGATCFEVNASPGYSWYEETTGQGISSSLARRLQAVG